MTATSTSPELGATASPSPYRVLHAAVGIGLVAVLIEAITLGFTTTTDSGPFQHAADYWLTAAAIPHAVAGILLLPAVRALQGGRDGGRGRVAIGLNTVSLLALGGICAASVAAGHEIQGGPTYVLGGLGTLVGTALFAAASWRAGLLPRWLLAVWPVVWIIGSWFAVSVSPLLLGIFYVALLVILHKQERRLG